MMKNHLSALRLTAALLSLVMCLCALAPALAGETMRDELLANLSREAENLVLLDDTDLNMYKNMKWTGSIKAMPERFDLRELGVVAEVRSQGSWGTCWGFASIAACETSILSKLNLTAAEYLDKYGKEMNLSEKHLAWFGAGHLPELSEYPEGGYIYPGLETQAGEGVYPRDTDKLGVNARYMSGGYMAYASGTFAAGMGPVYESMAPYEAADGTQSTAADWSLDDSLRHGLAFELENSSILPSPSIRDADGNYVYNAIGTEAIKSELLSGRGVSIAYHADIAIDPDAQKKRTKDRLAAMGIDATEHEVELVIASNTGDPQVVQSFSIDDMVFLMRVMLISQGADIAMVDARMDDLRAAAEASKNAQQQTDADAAAAQAAAEAAKQDEAAKQAEANAAAAQAAREAATALGLDYDAYLSRLERVEAAMNAVYINTATYAQYTDSVYAAPTHAVTIVGWDDSYSASNFLADHRPPADGAWIVRNSWGASYGIDGYFYLSYYDQSVTGPETFDFMVSDIDRRTSQVDIMSHDYMQARSVNSVQMKETTSIANVFEIESDSVLSYVSVLTAELNTDVTAVVCLLNDNATTPIDGTILDVVSAKIEYGGYHRLALNHNYAVPAGAKVSVVQLQRADTTEGMVFTIPYTVSTNQKYLQAQNIFEPHDAYQAKTWVEGRIGKGESYIYQDGGWADWADVIAELQASSNAATYLSYDNLNMKLYAYPLSEIEALHKLEEPISFNGANAQICLDCGYTLVEQ